MDAHYFFRWATARAGFACPTGGGDGLICPRSQSPRATAESCLLSYSKDRGMFLSSFYFESTKTKTTEGRFFFIDLPKTARESLRRRQKWNQAPRAGEEGQRGVASPAWEGLGPDEVNLESHFSSLSHSIPQCKIMKEAFIMDFLKSKLRSPRLRIV